jgi:hypothetical protein
MTRVYILFLACAALPDEAQSAEWIVRDTTRYGRPEQFDVTGTLDTDWLGASLWYGLPILPQGFIAPMNDSFDLELGGHVMLVIDRRRQGTFGLMPLGGVRWNFHLTRDWTVFTTLKLGAELIFGDRFAPTGDGSIGAYLHVSRDLYVRMELGTHGVLRGGVSFPF